MRYRVSAAAARDLSEIAEWIIQDNPRRAIQAVRELRAEFGKIAQQPRIYQLRPEIGENVRLATFGRHVILFWIDGDMVRFERVAYGGRDLPSFYQNETPA